VDFNAEARFRDLKRTGPLLMRSVRFGAAASFHDSTLRQLSFPACRFHGPLQAKKLEVEDELAFNGAHFENTRALDLCAGTRVDLRNTSFALPLTVTVKSPALDATGTCFEQGVDIALEPGSRTTFKEATFGDTSLIATNDREGNRAAKIESMDSTRVGRLTLEGLDLSECSFARLHRLDDVLIGGRGQLALAPEKVKGSYRREILADELALSSSGEGERARRRLRAPAIADVYRSMRKAREASHDYPGAADFYYGEMEMRRSGANNWVERLILTLYWLFSGYGMRAGRAVVAYAVAVLLLSVGFQTVGFAHSPSFPHTVAWTLTASISLTRSTEAIHLSTVGMYMNVLARLLGPALIGLAVLALRSRVRR
jgi:hypothetical protein